MNHYQQYQQHKHKQDHVVKRVRPLVSHTR